MSEDEAQKAPAGRWKRRLIVGAVMIAGVAGVVLAATVFASMASERHLALESFIGDMANDTFASSDRRKLIAKALSDYSFARTLQVWSAIGGAALTWVGFGLHLFGRAPRG